MVWFKSTEIEQRKRGYNSIAKEFDQKIDDINLEYQKKKSKIELIIDKKKKLIEKLTKEIEQLENSGMVQEIDFMNEIKSNLESDIQKHQALLDIKEIPTVSKLLKEGVF